MRKSKTTDSSLGWNALAIGEGKVSIPQTENYQLGFRLEVLETIATLSIQGSKVILICFF